MPKASGLLVGEPYSVSAKVVTQGLPENEPLPSELAVFEAAVHHFVYGRAAHFPNIKVVSWSISLFFRTIDLLI